MEIYLIRHTTPDVQKGTCYGQADLDTTASFTEEAACIRPHLPPNIQAVWSSPLKRCRQLAEHLFPHHSIQFDSRLKEIDCGHWELRLWDDIEPEPVQQWLADFVNLSMPGGESYQDVYRRTKDFFESIPAENGPIAIVSHGGVIRSILCHIEKTDLKDSFKTYSLFYGCVVKVQKNEGGFSHTILHNPVQEKEQHRPKSFR